MKLASYSDTGRKNTITVSDEMFGAKPNQQLLAQAVRVYQANLRQVSSQVKTRAQVKRTKRKWFKQKGTGNARHGARSAHIFVGGGVAHGPKADQTWRLELSKKQKTQALISALSTQAPQTSIVSLKNIQGKTKQAVQLLNKLGAKGQILLIIDQFQPEVMRSFSNLKNVLLSKASMVNTLEVASADWVLIDKQALPLLEKRLSTQ